LPPRGSIQSALLEEMVHRERLRLWKEQEIKLFEQAFAANPSQKTLDEVTNLRSSFMRMALHLEGAYDLKERESIKSEEPPPKTDREILELLDKIPEFNGGR
jgi:hypothetical protein